MLIQDAKNCPKFLFLCCVMENYGFSELLGILCFCNFISLAFLFMFFPDAFVSEKVSIFDVHVC